ncbi:hypothetical protein CI109_105963 [Kwoniella shandongensis]|uniref:Uncharacterized protein n=1 Tax=Kwoniella shandongensis TaxID=1734106 RepID=A0A5M6BZR0_9TREE|nr:uncharacterized protein CI109_003989 [Kwoniella shandongensis]KAA5527730.1 hypothetical protein CI109_003989 [Kwoniella shandongensis]
MPPKRKRTINRAEDPPLISTPTSTPTSKKKTTKRSKEASSSESPKKQPQSQSSPNVPLQILPPEILTHILSYLSLSIEQGTLANCCLVSKELYNIASPLLWYHLRLSPWKTKTDEKGEEVIDETKEKHGGMHSRQPSYKRLREMVKVLTVHNHHVKWCRCDLTTTLALPNLHTLHLALDPHASYHQWDCDDIPPTCRLLKSLRPKRLVMHNVHTTDPGFFDHRASHLGLGAFVSPATFSEVEELFLLCDAPLARSDDCDWSPRFISMPKLQRICWIYTWTGLRFNVAGAVRSDPHACALAGTIAEHPDVEVFIVNAGGVNGPRSECDEQSMQEEIAWLFAGRIRSQLVRKGYDDEKVQRRMETVNYHSRQAYLDMENWKDVLDEKEVIMWLEEDKGPVVDVKSLSDMKEEN